MFIAILFSTDIIVKKDKNTIHLNSVNLKTESKKKKKKMNNTNIDIIPTENILHLINEEDDYSLAKLDL